MHNKINIMHVTGALSFGGLERIVIDICSNLNRDIFQPFVLCTASEGEFADELRSQGIAVILLDGNRHKLKKYFAALYLLKYLRKYKIDIVHSHNTGPLLDSALAVFLSSNAKLIHTEHGRHFPDKIRYMILEYLASKVASKIITVSPELKEELVKYEKFNPDKVQVITNGINGEKFQQKVSATDLKTNLGIPDKALVVGSVAVLRPEKGGDVLLEAAAITLKSFPNTHFVLVGDGPERKKLEAHCASLNIQNNVHFLGLRADIPVVFALIDIFLLPSRREGLPVALLEAMAASKAIVATSVGAIPGVIADSQSGCLVSPGDFLFMAEKIMLLLGSKSIRETMGEQANKDFKNKYDVSSMVGQYEVLYSSTCAKSN